MVENSGGERRRLEGLGDPAFELRSVSSSCCPPSKRPAGFHQRISTGSVRSFVALHHCVGGVDEAAPPPPRGRIVHISESISATACLNDSLVVRMIVGYEYPTSGLFISNSLSPKSLFEHGLRLSSCIAALKVERFLANIIYFLDCLLLLGRQSLC